MNSPDFKKPLEFNEDGFKQLAMENFRLRKENIDQLRKILSLSQKINQLQRELMPDIVPLIVTKGGLE